MDIMDMDLDLHGAHSLQELVTLPSSSNPMSTKRVQKRASSKEKIKSKPTSKDQNMHSIIFSEGEITDGTPVIYMAKGKKKLEGSKERRGIRCSCCSDLISPSQFEAHAGMSKRKKPYENIFFENGLSLHEYSRLKLTGECLGPISIDVAGGTDSGTNLIEEANRCFRIIENPNRDDLVACALCRSYDFCEDGFNDQTVIVCEQCELEFHIGCLREHYMANLKALPSGSWFCSVECGVLNHGLKVLVTCGQQPVPDTLVGNITDLDVQWVIVRGKGASEGNKLLLEKASEIFHDCFSPIIDVLTGMDYIEAMTNGKSIGPLNFDGVHCAILKIGTEVVTAGLFRVFGHELVELLIVATRRSYQGKGYFKLFFTCFEKVLWFHKIKKLVVAAAKDQKPMWISKFGFREVTPEERSEYRKKQTSLVEFRGTCLLEKTVHENIYDYKKEILFSLLYPDIGTFDVQN